MRRAAIVLILPALLLSGAARADEPASATFGVLCASCHGKDARGRTPLGRKWGLPDFTSAGWQSKHTDSALKSVIREGRDGTRMRPFKDKLSPKELDALVKHLRSLGR